MAKKVQTLSGFNEHIRGLQENGDGVEGDE